MQSELLHPVLICQGMLHEIVDPVSANRCSNHDHNLGGSHDLITHSALAHPGTYQIMVSYGNHYKKILNKTIICRLHDVMFMMSFHFPKAKLGECNNYVKKQVLVERGLVAAAWVQSCYKLCLGLHITYCFLLSSGELTSPALPQRVTCIHVRGS